MIDQLLDLTLADFRAFGGQKTIPLDANIILVHGTNGAAKSSLLAGIEFALTGEVSDLIAYGEDYPRCLRTLGVVGETVAKVRYRDEKGETREVGHALTPGSPLRRDGEGLTLEERSFFIDRCYLSQNGLGRLLENYQASDRDQPEQPLVRFVRELLGLDLLENLTSGLYEVGHIARIEKSVRPLREAREVLSQSDDLLAKIGERRTASIRAFGDAIDIAQKAVAEIADPVSQGSWDAKGIEEKLLAFDRGLSGREDSERLLKLRHAQGRFQKCLGLLGPKEEPGERDRLQRELKGLESKKGMLCDKLRESTSSIDTFFKDIGLDRSSPDDVVASFVSASDFLAKWSEDFQGSIQRLSAAEAELKALRQANAEVSEQLSACKEPLGEEIADKQRFSELLVAMVSHVHGEQCPVCKRDFSELNEGSLMDRILAEVSAMGASMSKIEHEERQRVALELKKGDMARRIAALEEQLANARPSLEARQSMQERVSSLLVECEIANVGRRSLEVLVREEEVRRTSLSTLELRASQRTATSSDMKSISSDVGLDIGVGDDPYSLEIPIRQYLDEEISKLEFRVGGQERLRAALFAANKAAQAVAQIDEELGVAQARRQRAEKLVGSMRDLMQEAKELSKAATDAKTKLLDQVFNETLNSLWNDLFLRLAKRERFRPWLAEPTTSRGQIRTTIQGRARTGEPFSQFAAVASSGNVSTAALSLFLALHLVEEPLHRLLMLDDPVQNMDDVHVVQLAQLLREIERSTKRQIIVTVHERALFDYLCLELVPCRPGGKLLAIQLQRDHPDDAPSFSVEEHVWKDDLLRFGDAGS